MKAIDKVIREHGALVGRSLIGLLFLFSGVGILMGNIDGITSMIAAKGIPLAILVAWAAVFVKIGGGICLILGYKTREASLALLGFVLLTILLFHGNLQDPNLFKNLAIMGGLFYVYIYGPGKGWRLKIKDKSSKDPSPAM